jgi:hypothetical protein
MVRHARSFGDDVEVESGALSASLQVFKIEQIQALLLSHDRQPWIATSLLN